MCNGGRFSVAFPIAHYGIAASLYALIIARQRGKVKVPGSSIYGAVPGTFVGFWYFLEVFMKKSYRVFALTVLKYAMNLK